MINPNGNQRSISEASSQWQNYHLYRTLWHPAKAPQKDSFSCLLVECIFHIYSFRVTDLSSLSIFKSRKRRKKKKIFFRFLSLRFSLDVQKEKKISWLEIPCGASERESQDSFALKTFFFFSALVMIYVWKCQRWGCDTKKVGNMSVSELLSTHAILSVILTVLLRPNKYQHTSVRRDYDQKARSDI